MPSTYITRTPASTGSQKTFTLSFWWKTTPDGQDKCLFSSGLNSSNYFMVRTTGAETLQILTKDNGVTGINYQSSQSFRDANAWYHIVLTIDTTQSSGDRVKYYVNGERVTAFAASVEPSASANVLYVNDTTAHAWGRKNVTADKYLNGSLSHVHFIDGTAYDATSFGSTDSTTGEWKINTSPSVTYGTNGYFILKDGNSVTDQSGNGNNWSVGGGTLTNTEDCPSNVFATLNPLDKGYTGTMNTSDGNLTMDSASGSGDYGMRSTLAANSGKYYWETKLPNYGGGNGGNTMVVMDASIRLQMNMQGGTPRAGSWGIQRYSDSSTNIYEDGTFTSQNTAMWGGFTTSDIIGIALDCDNGKIYFSKNGVFKDKNGNTGDPANGTNPTFSGLDTSKFYTFYTENRANVDNGTTVNFGNGYFQTTAVSSAGTNASGIGIFEYDVPTGFTALSTKGLNL